MADVNPQHMIEEIQDNIKTGDALKAQLVLSHIGDVDDKIRNKLIYLLSRAEMDFAVPLFIYLLTEHVAVADEMPIIRETLFSILLAFPEKLVDFLSSHNITDKIEIIKIVGELRFEEATRVLLNLVAASEDEFQILLIKSNYLVNPFCMLERTYSSIVSSA